MKFSLYVMDSGGTRFLQRGASMQSLKATKNTITRWNNEMGHPQPDKGAQLVIFCGDQQVSKAEYGGTRIRWYDEPANTKVTKEPQTQSIWGR